jgi:hypothetical protein
MRWLSFLIAVALWPIAAVIAGLVVTGICLVVPPYLVAKALFD